MKRIFLFMVMALLMVATSACGKQRADVVKKVDAFNTINIVGRINVVYEQGSGYEVRLDNNADACVDVRVDNSSLNLSPKSKSVSKVGGVYYNSVDWTEGFTVYVKAPSVGSFALAGSGSISVDGMTAKRVTFSLAGSGSVTVKQLSADNVSFSVAGSGRLKATGVTAGKANLSVAGSGSIKADVTKVVNLICSVAGSCNVTVSGKAGQYTKSVFGGGSITDDALKYGKISKSSGNYSDGGTYNFGNNGGDTYRNMDDANGILSNP